MAHFYTEPSRTLSEYLLLPGLTKKVNTQANVSLKTPIVKYKKGETPELELNIPFTSAIMQAVSNHTMAIALAKAGGISFIFGSQPVEAQAEMVRKVKRFKAGFVSSDSNITPDSTLQDVIVLAEESGHTTQAVTNDGTASGKLLGMITSRDYRVDVTPLDTKVSDMMTPFSQLIVGEEGITLEEANDLIWDHKLNSLPIIDKNQCLSSLVFRKDYDDHKEHPDELIDAEQRLVVGAGINSRDFEERVPALVEAGADILCLDSSDGYSEWQYDTIQYIRKNYGDKVKIGAGNVVDGDGFRYLADAGADFIKVGIGGGSICITREQKGIGRGQATAVIEVAKARDEYFKETGVYIPLCSDGGIVHDYHITLSLAMGADFVMLGRYFARFDESPSKKHRINGTFVKEYWGEGANKARNWQRYDMGGSSKLHFEEGVDGYVPYAGKLKDNLALAVSKIKSTMCNCGALTIAELQKNAQITPISTMSLREGSAHDIIQKDRDYSQNQ